MCFYVSAGVEFAEFGHLSGCRRNLLSDGEDLTWLPLLERKARLEALLSGAPAVIRFSSHVIGNGAEVSELGSTLGVEGTVSKQVDRPYMPGNRGVWVKTKFLERQEFVIVGWTDPEGSRSSLGALLLGYYRDDDKLISAGRAGTGMTEFELLGLLEKLRPLASDRMRVGAPPPKTSRFGKPLVLAPIRGERIRPPVRAAPAAASRNRRAAAQRRGADAIGRRRLSTGVSGAAPRPASPFHRRAIGS